MRAASPPDTSIHSEPHVAQFLHKAPLAWILGSALLTLLILPVILLFIETAVPTYHSVALLLTDTSLIVLLVRYRQALGIVILTLFAYILVAIFAVTISQPFATTPQITDANGNPLPNSIAVIEKVSLGGSEQWITIRGKDVNKPVLLYLGIGGPGAGGFPANALTPATLEENFVVVTWDQLGAGKSYNAAEIPTLTLKHFFSDVHELAQMLRQRFHEEKIYVLGVSWGTILGIKLVQQYPDLFYPYVGNGQMANITRLPYILGQTTSTEALADYELLKKYTEYYRSGRIGNRTVFGPWRGHVLADKTFNGDTSYHRTVCNTVAVSAIVKEQEPQNTNINWTVLAAMLNAVMVDYDLDIGKGWGYGGNDGGAPGLYWHTPSIGYPCAVATALMWNHSAFDQTKRNLAVFVLRDLAERVSTYRTDSYYDSQHTCVDSWVEVAAHDASFLAVMSQFDRVNPAASGWLESARRMMKWAYANQTPEGCPVPNGGNYTNLLTNHKMYPNPYYSLAIVMETSRALMPWLAQGVLIQSNATDIDGIPALGLSSGNQDLYGGDISRPHMIYNSASEYVNLGGNLAFSGTTYNVTDNFVSSISFSSKHYYGRSGVIDWGTGVEVLHAAFVYPLFLDVTFYASLSNESANYWHMLNYEKSHPNKGYLPPPGPSPCTTTPVPTSVWSPSDTPPLWHTSFLSSACAARGNAALVPYMETTVPTTAEQVNTHFYLNSLKAFNHLVSYLIMKGHQGTNQWEPNGSRSTLPLFSIP